MARVGARARSQSKRREQASQARYRANVARLQKAGLLDKVNTKIKRDPKAQRAIIRYRDYLAGKQSAIKTEHAKDLAKKFGFKKRGNVVLIPRVKHERITVTKKTGEVVTRYPNPLDKTKTVKRVYGQKGLTPPKPGEKLYYTIRERARGLGRLKRRTFSSFDDLLEYLKAYDYNWDDVEPYIETESVSGGQAAQYDETIRRERRAGHERWRRRHRPKRKRRNKRKR